MKKLLTFSTVALVTLFTGCGEKSTAVQEEVSKVTRSSNPRNLNEISASQVNAMVTANLQNLTIPKDGLSHSSKKVSHLAYDYGEESIPCTTTIVTESKYNEVEEGLYTKTNERSFTVTPSSEDNEACTEISKIGGNNVTKDSGIFESENYAETSSYKELTEALEAKDAKIYKLSESSIKVNYSVGSVKKELVFDFSMPVTSMVIYWKYDFQEAKKTISGEIFKHKESSAEELIQAISDNDENLSSIKDGTLATRIDQRPLGAEEEDEFFLCSGVEVDQSRYLKPRSEDNDNVIYVVEYSMVTKYQYNELEDDERCEKLNGQTLSNSEGEVTFAIDPANYKETPHYKNTMENLESERVASVRSLGNLRYEVVFKDESGSISTVVYNLNRDFANMVEYQHFIDGSDDYVADFEFRNFLSPGLGEKL